MTESIKPKEDSMFFQPFLQVRELDGARFLQRTRGEAPHPVVMDAKPSSYGAVLPYPRLNICARFLDALFYGHVATLVLTPL